MYTVVVFLFQISVNFRFRRESRSRVTFLVSRLVSGRVDRRRTTTTLYVTTTGNTVVRRNLHIQLYTYSRTKVVLSFVSISYNLHRWRHVRTCMATCAAVYEPDVEMRACGGRCAVLYNPRCVALLHVSHTAATLVSRSRTARPASDATHIPVMTWKRTFHDPVDLRMNFAMSAPQMPDAAKAAKRTA